MVLICIKGRGGKVNIMSCFRLPISEVNCIRLKMKFGEQTLYVAEVKIASQRRLVKKICKPRCRTPA